MSPSLGRALAGVKHICVQSMDGQMAFFEQEALIFARFLPDFLLPGPLCYCPTLDAFITCNSALEVVCYKYQTLAAAQAAVDKTEGLEISVWTTRPLSLLAIVSEHHTGN